MPTALMCTLRPTTAAFVPANLGRATHAAILAQIAAADPALAARLHSEEGFKPLTVSNVLGLDQQADAVRVTPARTYGLRVTLLCAALEDIARAWSAEALGALTLDGTIWRVERVDVDATAHPAAGHASYESLAAAALRRGIPTKGGAAAPLDAGIRVAGDVSPRAGQPAAPAARSGVRQPA